MAFREKAAYISFFTSLLIWGYYFSLVAGVLAANQVGDDLFVGTFIGCVVLSVLVQIGYHLVTNGVIFFVVLAELVRSATLILQYRRDAMA